MGITIDELITWCEEEEQDHRIKCKRADDASGYTRSKDKRFRTEIAIREEVYGDFYKQTADIMRKYQKIQEIVERFKNQYDHTTSVDLMVEIKEVVEDGKID